MWSSELDVFIQKYKIYKKERKMRQEGIQIKTKKKKSKTKKMKITKVH